MPIFASNFKSLQKQVDRIKGAVSTYARPLDTESPYPYVAELKGGEVIECSTFNNLVAELNQLLRTGQLEVEQDTCDYCMGQGAVGFFRCPVCQGTGRG